MKKKEEGMVLTIVIVVIALLSIIVVDFVYSTHINYEISTNYINDIKAGYMAKSGVNVVKAALKENNLEEIAKKMYRFQSSQSDNLIDGGNWKLAVSAFPVGDGFVSILVKDERAKFNLNSLVQNTTNQVDFQVLTALTELFEYLEIDSDKSSLFISSLINWLDSDINNTLNDQDPRGANSSYYSALDIPYKIKDGPLDSLDEIKLIHGMDEEFFDAVSPYLTVYTKDKKINLSTSPKVVIMAAMKAAQVSAIRDLENSSVDLKDDTAEQIADAIIEERSDTFLISRNNARKIIEEIDSSLTISDGLSGVALSKGRSRTFRVISTGIMGGGTDPTYKEIDTVIYKTSLDKRAKIDILAWRER